MCREYSFRGNRQSQTTPMSMHNAERYGGNLRSRGSRRRASNFGASMVISTLEIFRKLQLHELLTDQCHPELCCMWWPINFELRINAKEFGFYASKPQRCPFNFLPPSSNSSPSLSHSLPTDDFHKCRVCSVLSLITSPLPSYCRARLVLSIRVHMGRAHGSRFVYFALKSPFKHMVPSLRLIDAEEHTMSGPPRVHCS